MNQRATVFMLMFFLTALGMKAGIEKSSARLTGSQINQGNILSIVDNKYPDVTLSGSAFINYSVGKIKLGIDYTIPNLSYATNSYSFDYYVVIKTMYAYANGTTGTVTEKLRLDYKNSNSINIDKSIGIIKGAHALTFVIDHFENSLGNPIVTPLIPSNLYIEAEIETERFYDLNPGLVPAVSHIVNSSTNELEVYWNSVIGAEEYELEWTYVNNYDNTSSSYDYDGTTGATIATTGFTTIDFTFLNNSTRIRTSKNSFNIGLNYNRGFIVYRVRAIGKDITDVNYEKIGNWSLDQPQTIQSFKLSGLSAFDDYYVITAGHEENKNWQYTATYAEGGLKKEVVSYFDGSQRNRQSVTKTNTENISIIAETIYDKQGRPSVQVLPAPSVFYSGKLEFYENFNQSKTFTSGADHLPFSRADIEMTSSGSCPYSPGPLYTGVAPADGASVYYSEFNTIKDNQNAYIPDAKEYPYTTTLYTPDNTGRVRYQSGVGESHRIGSNHETKYLYGDPDQEDLDKLFGSEAGYAERFKKNMVIDANGQISVSYLNTEGKTVATALAGNSPETLNSIGQSVYNVSASYFHYSDSNYDQINKPNNHSVIFGKKIIPNTSGIYTMDYSLTVPTFTDECIPEFCYDCVYDLDITITDECATILYNNVKKVGLNSGNQVDYTCNSTPATYSTAGESTPFSVYLYAGKEYFLTKTLSINNDALLEYAQHYTDTTQYSGIANNICTKTLHDFSSLPTNTVSTLGCDMTCEQCTAQVEAYYLLHNDAAKADINNVTYDANYIYMSPAQKALAIKTCLAPCASVSLCKAQFGNLLQDVSPNGQYAQYNITTTSYDATSYELSIFNSNNKLPLTNQVCSPNPGISTAFSVSYHINTAHWKTPEYYNEATYDFTSPDINYTAHHYFNADGTISKVRLIRNGTGFLPLISDTTIIFTDGLGLWTYPENLIDVKDFINNYISNSHWSYALVKYHPEFNYFLDCSRQSKPAFYSSGASVFTSEDYDALLRGIDSFVGATNTSNPFTLNTTTNDVTDLVNADPYFNNSGPATSQKTAFINQLSNFLNISGTALSIKQAAAIINTTGNMYYTNCTAIFGAAVVNCASTTINVSAIALDNMWKAYREFYLIEKAKFLSKQSQLNAVNISAGSSHNSNYYNGAIGDKSFDEYNSFINYNFYPFFPYPSFSWSSAYVFLNVKYNPNFYPNCTVSTTPSLGNYYYPSGSSGVPNGFYDFGSPSSYYHYKKYVSKIRRFPDQQTLNNNLAGGATDPNDIASLLESNANKSSQLNTGECADYTRLELFLNTTLKNTTLIDGFQHQLVNENSFTQNLYDQLLGCTSYAPKTWHPLAFKSTINSSSLALTLDFYDGSTILSNASIVLSPPSGSGFTNWSHVKLLNLIHFAGNTAGVDAFTMNALYDDGVTTPFNIILNGSTSCIKNNCDPPSAFSCKATQQALDIAKFLNGVVGDNTAGSSFPLDLSNNTFFSSQNFSALVRFPFGTTSVTSGSHMVNLSALSIRLSGSNSGLSSSENPVTVTFNFTPLTSGNLSGAVGFTNLVPKQNSSDLYDFTIKAVYNVAGVISYKTFKVTVTYQDNTGSVYSCGETNQYACRRYKFGQCDESVSMECENNPEYQTGIDFFNFLNLSVIGSSISGNSVPLNTLVSYSGLLQSSIGSSATYINVVNTSAYLANVTSFTTAINFMGDTVGLPICSVPITFTVSGDQSSGLSANIVSVSEFKVLDESLGKFKLTILLSDGSDMDAIGFAPCIKMQSCDPCPYDTINFKEDFDGYEEDDNGVTPLNFTANYINSSNAVVTCAFMGLEQNITSSSDKGDYAITSYNSTFGKSYDHTKVNPNHYYLMSRTPLKNSTFVPNQGLVKPALNYYPYISNPIPVTLGTQYEFSVYYKNFEDTPIASNISLMVNNGISDITIASNQMSVSNSNGWTKLKGLVNATSTSLILKVRLTQPAVANVNFDVYSEILLLDDIVLQEKKCTAPQVYNSLSSLPPEPDCVNQMTNIGISNVQQAFVSYLDNVKKDFERRYTDKCLQSIESLSAQYTSSEGHYTLYYYDQAGNLIKTVPPEGVEQLVLTDPGTTGTIGQQIKNDRANHTKTVFTTHRMVTRYEYNSLNQLIKQSVPDQDQAEQWNTNNNVTVPVSVQASGIDFSDTQNGYLIGNDGTNGLLFTTQDGGKNWSPVTSLGLSDMIDLEVNGSKAYVIASDGSLLTSLNYTSANPTWQTVNIPGSNLMSFTDVTFVNSSNGYIVGKAGVLLETTDGGLTWNPVSLSTTNNLTKIHHRNDGTGTYIVITGENGTLYYKELASSFWTQYMGINPQIDLNNCSIISTGDGTSTFMDIIVCGVDNSGTIHKAFAMQLKGINGTTPLISVISLPAGYLSTTAHSTFYTIVRNTFSNPVSTNELYLAGVTQSIPPKPLLIHLTSTTAYPYSGITFSDLYNTSLPNAGITDISLKMPNGTASSDVLGTLKNGQLIKYNATANLTSAYPLYTSGSTVNTSPLNGIWLDASNTSQGYVIGNSGTIISFTDLGTSVTSSALNTITYPKLNSVSAAKDGSGKVYVVGNNGTVIFSNNTGASWQYLASAITQNLQSVLYVSGLTPKVVIGGTGAFIGEIDVATNVPALVNGSGSATYYAIQKANGAAGNIFLVGENMGTGVISNYPLGGNVVSTINTTAGLRDINFINPNLAYAVGQAGTILKSVNNGVSFTAQNSGSASNLNKIIFKDQLTGYVLGNGSTVLKTTDGGLNWVPKASPSGTGLDINAVYDFGNGNLVAAGIGSPNVFNMADQSNDFSSRFYYDALGRLVISQNTKQFNKTIKAYSYTIYDALGRISQVGEISGSYLPDPFMLTTNNGIIDINSYNTWLTLGIKTEVTSTLYDVAAGGALCSFSQDNLRKRVSATYLDNDNNLGNGYQYATYYSYDIHGNVKSLVNENPNMPTGHTCKKIDYSYDLISGKVLKVVYQKGSADEFNHKYEYDADNRITNVLTSKDGYSWEQDAKYFYYKHGPLARVEIGNEKVQGMDYAYTIQGWIKGINSSELSETTDIGKDGASGTLYNPAIADMNKYVSKDAASYSLNYFGNDYAPIDASKNTLASKFNADAGGIAAVTNSNNWLYNGNISSMGTTITNPLSFGTAMPQLTAYKYDQLNRINTMTAYAGISSNAWNGAGGNNYLNEFTYDANGNIETQSKYDASGSQTEALIYRYHTEASGKKLTNRLYHVNDLAGPTTITDDIEDQGTFIPPPAPGILPGQINTANNYGYDEIGNLARDKSEGIETIEWSVYGKISKITRTAGYYKTIGGNQSYPDNLEFLYDASGNRIAKIVKPRDASGEKPQANWIYTYYSRDAQGNVMAIYKKDATFELTEHSIYGSSRLGMQNYTGTDNLGATSEFNTGTTSYIQNRYSGNRNYELSNHLGNVLTVISDRKLAVDNNSDNVVDYYLPDIISATDYGAFGAPMPGRNYNSTNYRYGFNGKEGDPEIKGEGNSLDFGARIYDPRLGRWLARDPQSAKYSGYSPYHFGYNNPIITIDPNGEENIVVIGSIDMHANDHNKFINTGLKKAEEYSSSKELTTIVLFTDGMTESQVKEVILMASKLENVRVATISGSSDNLTNYLNSKGTDSKLSEARKSDPITDIAFFGHGYGPKRKDIDRKSSTFEPGHGIYPSNTKEHDDLTWGSEDIAKLDPLAFDNVVATFESCNSATPNTSGNSLANDFAFQTKGVASGWNGKSDYSEIYSAVQSWFGSSKHKAGASANYPSAGRTDDRKNVSTRVTYSGKTR